MTREEAIAKIKRKACFGGYNNKNLCQWADEGFGKCEECENYMAIKALEQQPCEDCISKQAVDELSKELVHTTRDKADFLCNFWEGLQKLPLVTPKEKIGYCKDCKWWKDNDGVYRRGIGAESKCPINRKEVYEGNGYCFMFEPQESEEEK